MAYFSNGSEGMSYENHYCSSCIHGGGDCPIWFLHLLYAYELCNAERKENPGKDMLDTLIPMIPLHDPDTGEYLYDGAGMCSMYEMKAPDLQLENPDASSPRLEDRVGKFIIEEELFHGNQEELRFILAQCIPAEVVYSMAERKFIYTAYSSLFDVAVKGEMAPEYTWELTRHEGRLVDCKPINLTAKRKGDQEFWDKAKETEKFFIVSGHTHRKVLQKMERLMELIEAARDLIPEELYQDIQKERVGEEKDG